MKKILKTICLLMILVLLSTNFTGCNTDTQISQSDKSPHDISTLEPATITICFMGYGSTGQPSNFNAINEMLTELNKKTLHALNTEIKFQWLPYQNYDEELKKLLKSENGPDAFYTYNIWELQNENLIMDLTELFPKCVPYYYSLLKEYKKNEIENTKIDNKTYDIINNVLYPPQCFVVAKQDLVEKYAPKGIKDLEEYGKFMQAVKENEKDIVPGYVSASDFIDAYMGGNGYFISYMTSTYGKLDAADIVPLPVEKIDKFDTAYNLFKQWKESDLLFDFASTNYDTIANNGQMASKLIRDGIQLHSLINNNDFLTKHQYVTYPLYPNSSYMNITFTRSIGINSNSRNSERVMKFIEWLQSSQENYDLLMYGIKDKNYRLADNSLDLKGIAQNDIIAGWWGSDALRNYIYDHPYSFEPKNYKDFLEKSKNNTMTLEDIYKKSGYEPKKLTKEEQAEIDKEYGKISADIQKRFSIYGEFIKQMNAGNFQDTLSDMMKESGGKESTDKILDFFENEMSKFYTK